MPYSGSKLGTKQDSVSHKSIACYAGGELLTNSGEKIAG